jgi:hypothetical protein
MSAKRLFAACAAVLGVWLTLAASAGAVSPPTGVTLATGPSCLTNLTEPPAWLDPEDLDAYTLSPAQTTAGFNGLTVSTQTLSFGNPTFSITTQGCWATLGDPEPISTPPFVREQWTTSQTVEINGFFLVPVNFSSPPTLIVTNDGTLAAVGPDTRYDIYAHTGDSPTGPLVVVGRVDLGQTPFHTPQVSGSLGSFGPSPQGPTFAGQSITGGTISISNTSPTGACLVSSHIAVQLPLPSEFSTGPSTGQPPTGEADYDVSVPGFNCGASNSGGGGGAGGSAGGFGAPSPTCGCVHRVHAAEAGDSGGQPIHLTVSDLYLGGLEIRNAFLDYDPTTNLWTGGGDLQFADGSIHAAPPPPNEGIGLFGDGSFDFGGATYNFSPPVRLYTGPPPVDLTQIGVMFALHPTVITGSAAISVADGEVTINGTALVAFGDANEPYFYQAGALGGVDNLLRGDGPITSFAAGISGIVDINDLPLLSSVQLGNGYVFYVSPGYFEFAGNVNQNLFGLVDATGHVQGQLDLHSNPLVYDLEGRVSVCEDFPVFGNTCEGIKAVVSSKGIAACGDFLSPTIPPVPIQIGFTYAWGDSSPGIAGPVSCDTSPFRVVVSSARDAGLARAAQAAGPVGFDLRGGAPSTSVRVTGSGGPPRIVISGPHGERLSNPDPGHGTLSPDLMIWPEPKLDETLIGIRHPSAGRWTVTPLAGSPAITGVSYAYGLPPARIQASVQGGGPLRTLRYRIRPRAGQTVTFVERGGGVFHVIGQASGSRGSLTFTPAVAVARHREIVALISLAGVPRENMVIARYTVPAPPRPATPTHVRVLRAGRDLNVSWLPADRWGCLVVATLSDGRRVLYRMGPMQHSLRISRLAPGIGARITVSDLDQTGNTSALADASLAPARLAAVTGIRIQRTGPRLAISWRGALGASEYLVTITVRGRTPVTLFGVTAHPALTLIKAAHYLLAGGAVAQITIRGVNPAGQPGLTATVRYAAGGSGHDTTQPRAHQSLGRALDAIE